LQKFAKVRAAKRRPGPRAAANHGPAHAHLYITIVIGLPNKLFQNTGNRTIVLVVQMYNMTAHFTILFVLIVLGKFVHTPRVLRE